MSAWNTPQSNQSYKFPSSAFSVPNVASTCVSAFRFADAVVGTIAARFSEIHQRLLHGFQWRLCLHVKIHNGAATICKRWFIRNCCYDSRWKKRIKPIFKSVNEDYCSKSYSTSCWIHICRRSSRWRQFLRRHLFRNNHEANIGCRKKYLCNIYM